MNVPTIAFVEPDRRSIAVCPVLPEFTFSPKVPVQRVIRPAIERSAPVHGPLLLPTIAAPKRPEGTKLVLQEAEQSHHDLVPYAKRFPHPVNEDRRPPIGTTVPLEGLGHFLARAEEIDAIARTQHLELPTAQQELGAISLSSSSGDEDDDGIDLAEKHACRYGTAYLTPEQSLLDRIEWERYVLRCSSVVKIFPVKTEDGRTVPTTNDKRVTREQLNAFGSKLVALAGGRSIDDIENDRERASYYKRLVWSLMTPAQQTAWTRRSASVQAYLNPSSEKLTIDAWQPEYRGHGLLAVTVEPDPDSEDALVTTTPPLPMPASGPQELGLHDTYRGAATYEPSPRTLQRWSRKVPRIYRWA